MPWEIVTVQVRQVSSQNKVDNSQNNEKGDIKKVQNMGELK